MTQPETELESCHSSEFAATTCDHCIPEKGNPAVCVCQECAVHLCLKHKSAHEENRFTVSHSLISVDDDAEMASLAAKLAKKQSILNHVKTCLEHVPKLADLYCVECKVVVCNSCQFLDEHENHKIKFVIEQQVIAVDDLKKARELVKAAQDDLYAKRDAVTGMVATLRTAKATAVEKLELERKKVLDKVEVDFIKSKATLDSIFERPVAKFQELTRSFENGINELKMAYEESRDAINSKNPFATVVKTAKISRWTESVNSLKKLVMPTATDDFSMKLEEYKPVEYFKVSCMAVAPIFKLVIEGSESFVVPEFGKGVLNLAQNENESLICNDVRINCPHYTSASYPNGRSTGSTLSLAAVGETAITKLCYECSYSS